MRRFTSLTLCKVFTGGNVLRYHNAYKGFQWMLGRMVLQDRLASVVTTFIEGTDPRLIKEHSGPPGGVQCSWPMGWKIERGYWD